MATKTSETEMIEGCRRGDQACWEKLYQNYYAHVRRVVGWRRWGFDQNETEDAVQEVFMSLVRALPSFREDASLRHFLSRLARNTCISHLRRKKALKRPEEYAGYDLSGDGDEESPRALAIDGEETPDIKLLIKEEKGALMKGFKQLGDNCQKILHLRYFRQLSYNEICGVLDLPLGTVCSRIKRCLVKLSDKVEG